MIAPRERALVTFPHAGMYDRDLMHPSSVTLGRGDRTVVTAPPYPYPAEQDFDGGWG